MSDRDFILCKTRGLLKLFLIFETFSVDMAIIHSKIAQSPSRTSEQSPSNTDMPMMHIPLSSGVNHNHLGPISKLLDNVSVTRLSQQTTPSVSHVTASQPQRVPKQSRTRKSQKSQVVQYTPVKGFFVGREDGTTINMNYVKVLPLVH